MTEQERNSTFEQYSNLINFVAYRHMSMLRVLQMDINDMKQELSIYLLRAIEHYQPDRGAKPTTYYIKMMRYGLLNLWREQVRKCRLANLNTVPLVSTNEDGEVIELELPFHVDYDMNVRISELLSTLSPQEQQTLSRVVNGDDPQDKRHKRFMAVIKRKALRYNLSGGVL